MNGMHELRYQLRVKDESALWGLALDKVLSYPDVTPEIAVEIIGPREDAEVVDCLLLLAQLSIEGCEFLTIECRSIIGAPGI